MTVILRCSRLLARASKDDGHRRRLLHARCITSAVHPSRAAQGRGRLRMTAMDQVDRNMLSGSRSYGNIAGMGEVVGAFASTDLRYERTNCAVETRNGARGNLAQQRFEFAVGQLDRVEVGRILRQIAKRRPRFLDRLANAGDQVDSAIV